jgi:hypothetical protein
MQWKGSKYYIFWICVCSLRYPECKAHAPCYTVIFGLPSSTVFFHFFSYMARFSNKKLLNMKIVFFFIFFTTFVWTIYHFKGNSATYDHKCVLVLIQSSRYSSEILIKLGFYRHISKHSRTYNLTKICPVAAKLFHADWQTDRQTDRQTLRI